MKTKLLLLLIEPFLVAKVVLCWITALPVLALAFSGLTVWDATDSMLASYRRGRETRRFQLRGANVRA
ncbi:MAG TPA: hypothetical protein VE758_02310 [Chthoniobacterales bacterium]|jgi:uncharacterized membrane protein|nr:hypothetical protein [Chthoniobacterales bacterium]